MPTAEPENIGPRRPIIGITLGDVAGIGPEILVRAWRSPRLHGSCRPLVIGDVEVLRREVKRQNTSLNVRAIGGVDELTTDPDRIDCLPASDVNVARLEPGRAHAAAGRAACDFLIKAIDLALDRSIDAIVTLPLNKAGLHQAGLHYPGHTEILAERTGTRNFAMMLYRKGLGVVHVTLHMALRDVFAALSMEAILEKIGLLDGMLRRLDHGQPRLAVAALNPHAGDDGVFGDEEARIIAPAVDLAQRQGFDATGPLPVDTLFVRASQGGFDGVVAMYHDQGHIALKLLGWKEAVNITVGLPIIRTSVAHGTAYDIVGKNLADPASLFEAVAVAARLATRV